MQIFYEMSISPARKISCRLITTFAGYSGRSVLLESIYRRGMSLPVVGPSLHAGNGMLFAWHCSPTQPWQDERWIEQQRATLRPSQFRRQILNEWVSGSETLFDMSVWDDDVDPSLCPVVSDPSLPIFIGVDASTKRDSTAIVATTFDNRTQQVRLVTHKIFQPTPDQPLNFEATVEATLLDYSKRFNIRKILFDPNQMVAVAQRLAARGLKIEEFPQTPNNLTAIAQNLFELVNGHNLVCYADATIRLAASSCIAIETPRGWRIAKEKQSHRIDVIVALAMSAYAAVKAQSKNVALDYAAMNRTDDDDPDGAKAWRAARLANYVNSFNPFFGGGGRWR